MSIDLKTLEQMLQKKINHFEYNTGDLFITVWYKSPGPRNLISIIEYNRFKNLNDLV
jgi:hypothetical protein